MSEQYLTEAEIGLIIQIRHNGFGLLDWVECIKADAFAAGVAAGRAAALAEAVRTIRKASATPQSRMTFDGGISRAAALVKTLGDAE